MITGDTNQPIGPRLVATVGVVFAAGLGVLSALDVAPIAPAGIVAYLTLAILPGAVFYALTDRRPRIGEWVLAALALSLVLVTVLGIAVMLLGFSARTSATLVVIVTGLAAVPAVWIRRSPIRLESSRSQAFLLVATILAVCAATSFLPLTCDWWRMRSDAWFHASVVAQIRDFGLPPEDPYAAGLPLQYMWAYHVLVLLLSEASGIGPFAVMALLNAQALCVFALAAYLFSSLFGKSHLHNYGAMVTTVFGMNALFWLFVPFRLVPAFVGEITGIDEVRRVLALRPFDLDTVREFLKVGLNQVFLLDKFMVATAFSLVIGMTAVLWYACGKYLKERTVSTVAVASLSAIGLVGFHPAVGVFVLAGVLAGLFLTLVSTRPGRLEASAPIRLIVTLAGSGVIVLPYLYSITHAKSGGPVVPLGFSAAKTMGIVVSCSLVALLAAYQLKAFIRTRQFTERFVLWATVALVAMSMIVNLPGANTADKIPFLPYFPLAVLGGWTIADLARRAKGSSAQRGRFLLIAAVAFAPLNILAFASYYNTPSEQLMSEPEQEIAAWVRAHTPRESVFFDSGDRVFLLVTGPRRYFFGHEKYVTAWGYDDAELARRKQLRTVLYSAGDPDPSALETLGSIPAPVFVIVREDTGPAVREKFSRHPDLFKDVFTAGGVTLFEVDRERCKSYAADAAASHSGDEKPIGEDARRAK